MRHSNTAGQTARQAVELMAVVVAVTDGEPRVLTLHDGQALPCGPFETSHRSLQEGLRAWVEQQTHHTLGYVEQLYTFADRDRNGPSDGVRTISISYLGLTRETTPARTADSGWADWYAYFPFEDRRAEGESLLQENLERRLREWAAACADARTRRQRRQRAAIAFGLHGRPWNGELVLQRYELLYEAGLVDEALRCRSRQRLRVSRVCPEPGFGRPMLLDHRRILATAMARLRAKLQYRPVVFELLPDRFTLLQLQRTVEGIAGRALHKQNFRRLVEQQQLVESTGRAAADTRGRPARLFRFRRAVLAERALVGTKLPLAQP